MGGARTQDGLVPYPDVVVKIRRSISAAEVSLRGARGPSPKPGPQLRIPMQGRLVPITSVCKNQQGLWMRR